MNSNVEECWHGQLTSKKAEERLLAVNKGKSYLFRESEVKRNRFIMSYISDKDRGLFKHLLIPTPTRKAFSSLSEASSVMERMVLTSDHCGNPVPPSTLDLSDMSVGDEPANDLACLACDIVCDEEFKFIRKSSVSLSSLSILNLCNEFSLECVVLSV